MANVSNMTVEINKRIQKIAKQLEVTVKMYDDEDVSDIFCSTIEARIKQQMKNKGMKARIRELETIVSKMSKKNSSSEMVDELNNHLNQ